MSPMDLPEILNLVLGCRSVLSPDDLANCSLVCRVWQHISRKAMWQEVELVSESWENPRYHILAAQLSKYGSFVRTLILEDCVSSLQCLLPGAWFKNCSRVVGDAVCMVSVFSLSPRTLSCTDTDSKFWSSTLGCRQIPLQRVTLDHAQCPDHPSG